jgi:hypothetical protein
MVNTAVSLGGGRAGGVLPLASLNHISIVCRSVEESLRFYTDVLGFVPIRRPGSFDFDGAWYAQRFSNSVVCTYQSTVLLPTDTAALPRTVCLSRDDDQIGSECLGCSITGSASTFCSRRTPAACRRRGRSTPRTTTSPSRYSSAP